MILKRQKRTFFTSCLVALCTAFFSFAGVADALDIVLEPSIKQREIGDLVRVQIYANPATDLISMGVKVSFDPAILQVDSASKYEDTATNNGWIMDADGDPATTADQYTNPPVEIDNAIGSVTMIGGQLLGSATTGMSGKVLLGSIVFEAVANGTSNLNVDLAKYHPNPPQTYDNFVQVDGTVVEPTNVKQDLGKICVVAGACLADLNNDSKVNVADLGILKQEFGRFDCDEPGKYCVADLNNDGKVNVADLGLLKQTFGQFSCPICN